MKRNKKQGALPQSAEIEKFVRLRDAKFETLLDTLFSTMDNLDKNGRRSLFRGVILSFLEKYVSVVELIGEKRKIQDIMVTFRAKNPVELDENLKFCISEMSSLIEGKKFEPIVSRLVCLYATLGISDKIGGKKCRNLAKDLISKHNRPELLALSILKRRTLNSGEEIPLDEYELLEQYTF
jgi:hypothetical protein